MSFADAIKNLIARVDRLERKPQSGIGGPASAITEGPDIDLLAVAGPAIQVGRGVDSILLCDDNGVPAIEFAYSGAGMAAALAAVVSGQILLIAAGTLTGDWVIPQGVKVIGLDRYRNILEGNISGGDETALYNMTIQNIADDGGDLVGVSGPAAGETMRLYGCRVFVTQSGAGDAYAVQAADGGLLYVWECELSGISVGGAGYAAAAPSGRVEIYHGKASGSTDRFPV